MDVDDPPVKSVDQVGRHQHFAATGRLRPQPNQHPTNGRKQGALGRCPAPIGARQERHEGPGERDVVGVLNHLVHGALAVERKKERRRREGIPSYAVGSDYVPRDMLANVHQGEIIVPAVPAAIIRTLVSNSGDSGSAELLAEVRALRDEVAGLRVEQREPAAATVRLANQFNNVSEGGNALRTEVMA